MTPLNTVKSPPIKIFPSDWTAIAATRVPLATPAPDPILKPVSSVPSAFNLAMRFWVTLLYSVKKPPTNIFPSGCSAKAITVLSNNVPVANSVSSVPSAFNLAMQR